VNHEEPALEISLTDPRAPEATALMSAMTEEVAEMYDHQVDGTGGFRPEDGLVAGGGFVVGRVESHAVACGGFRPLAPGVAEIKRMFVQREHRGCGYARAVLATLERLARDSGYAAVRLETRYRQATAIALYEGTGYRRIPNYGSYAGKEAQCLCYEKALV
jgi:GNAT superfamily N-acetyltransferase